MNDLSLPDNPRAVVGDNNPPTGGIEASRRQFDIVSNWLAEHPVIEDRATAVSASAALDGAKGALDAMERERDSRVRPLNEAVKAINEEYKGVRTLVERVLHELKNRLQRFMLAEEEKRRAEAEEKRRIAEEAAEKARAAEAAEQEAKTNAAEGEFTDVGAATAQADEAFSDFLDATRQSKLADRDAHVRIGGGARVTTLRTHKELVVDDPIKALRAIIKPRGGALPEKIEAAIVAAARDYRKAHGKLPDGISENVTRRL